MRKADPIKKKKKKKNQKQYSRKEYLDIIDSVNNPGKALQEEDPRFKLFRSKKNQEAIETLKTSDKWLKDWINHPEYKKRLTKTVEDLTGYDAIHNLKKWANEKIYDKNIDEETAQKLINKANYKLNTVKSYYNKGTAEHPLTFSSAVADDLLGEDEKYKRYKLLNYSAPAYNGSLGLYNSQEHATIIPRGFKNEEEAHYTNVHEKTHVTGLDDIYKEMTNITEAALKTRVLDSLKSKYGENARIGHSWFQPVIYEKKKHMLGSNEILAKGEKAVKQAVGDFNFDLYDHILTKPEVYPRLMELRYKGDFKPGEDVTKEQLLKAKKGHDSNLYDIYNDDQVLWMLNNFASNDTKTNDNLAAYGGAFPQDGPGPKGVLQKYYEATGNDPKNYGRMTSFLKTLAEAESFSGKKQSSDKSSAKGIYHYLDGSVKTSEQRIQNLFKKHGVDEGLQKEITAAFKLPVEKRSEEIQSLMVLSDLMQKPEAPYQAWAKGEVSDEELYYRGHHTVAKDSISSKDQVYSNWTNANTRLSKSEEYYNPNNLQNVKDYQPTDRTREDYLNMLNAGEYGAGGLSEILGTATDAMGGPLGMANIGAGVVNALFSGMQGPDYNKNETLNSFDFGADYTQKQGEQVEGVNNVFDSVSGAVQGVPLVGNIAALGVNALKAGSKVFTPKASDEDIMGDYMKVFNPVNMANRKAAASEAFAESGGSFGSSDYLDVTSPELKQGGFYPIAGNDTHETNPQRGYTFSETSDGKRNKAEAGEVVLDGPKGQKLIFTNRF